jgi:hypothetical protein
MKGPGVAAQPTEGLGAKSGGEAAPAAVANAMAPKLKAMIAGILDMVTLSLHRAIYRRAWKRRRAPRIICA